MKVSIIIPILDSHEVFRRQCLHFEKMGIPDDTEIIIVDDGSSPPHQYSGPLPLRIIYTNDTRPWTWALARNRGAREAKGEYLIMYDVDHVIRRDLLDMVRRFDGQKIQFLRQYGVLLEDGTFTQDPDTLIEYGLPKRRLVMRGTFVPAHPNMFAMRKDIFWSLGGYREDLVERQYPQGEDSKFKGAWHQWVVDGKGQVCEKRPTIYTFPVGYLCGGDVDADKKSLFHKLTRKTERNLFYKRQKLGHYRNFSDTE